MTVYLKLSHDDGQRLSVSGKLDARVIPAYVQNSVSLSASIAHSTPPSACSFSGNSWFYNKVLPINRGGIVFSEH